MKNRIMIFVLMFMAFLALSTSLMASDYTVSGAGTGSCNGTYVQDVFVNGKTSYKLSGSTTFYLYFNNANGSYWFISTDTLGTDFNFTDYYVSSTADTPPSSGWNSGNNGYNPAPTITKVGPAISYSTDTFYESSANDGTIDNSSPVIIIFNNFGGETFTGSYGDNFVTAGKVIVTNLPSGLTAVVTRISSTTLSVTITGVAPTNNSANDVSNLTFAFQNSAFSGGDASNVSNSSKNNLMVNFINHVYTVAISGGDFTTLSAALDASADGDFIKVNAGTYTESGLTVTKNITIQGQGAASTILQGAASPNTAASRVIGTSNTAVVTIKNMSIRYGNISALHGGGGVYNSGTLILMNISVNNNYSSTNGGGISNEGTLTVINCTINNNTSGGDYSGGGIDNSGFLTIINSTITGNSAANGGGISTPSSAILTNCTITNNSAPGNGAGLYVISANITIYNTIIAGNGSSDYHVQYGVSLTDNGYNIVENQTMVSDFDSWNFYKPTDILYSHDYLGNIEGESGLGWNRNDATITGSLNLSVTLADNNTINGTQTLATTAGSFAIDNGTNAGATLTDQRGAARNGITDIGSYEWWSDDGELPVELTTFSASITNNKVTLNWHTAIEVNNHGFDIERSPVNDQSSVWNKIGFVAGSGNSNSTKSYSYKDTNVSIGKYSYRLKQIDNDGQFEYSKTIEVDLNSIPTEFLLEQNYPNPFNPTTNISYALPCSGLVQIKVFNLLGKEIATLINEEKKAGTYKINWNAANLPSGVYLYRIQAGSFIQTKKMILLK